MANLNKLKNRYEGERIILVGNGPSLNETPLDELNDEYTFAINKINSIYGKTDWRPSFYFMGWTEESVNREKRESEDSQFVEEHLKLGIPCFLNSDLKDIFGSRDNVCYFDKKTLLDTDNLINKLSIEELEERPLEDLYKYWSDDPRKIVYNYHSAYMILQLVNFMGFDSIYLVGCDLGFENKSPHMVFKDATDPYLHARNGDGKISFLKNSWKNGNICKSMVNVAALKTLEKETGRRLLGQFMNYTDNTHFSGDYLSDLKPQYRLNLNVEISKSHLIARRIFDDKDIIYKNATIGGELDLLPRVDIETLLSDKPSSDVKRTTNTGF